tara:strand:- start:65 stop:1348 length:1284 start_codon:yes stop_codon:yes gene_type:complete
MKNKGTLLNLIIVGMTLGTTWAIRGQFGHEQGAAWAGGVGAVCILLIANRQDWYSKLFKSTLAAAIGWGLGGIMSYGVVVGYGRGSGFVNVYYGLLMLFVIGGLYGFLGGGLFGLSLTDSKKNKVKWHQLLIGMTVGGIVTYFFMVMQWEWLMTPPRSEVWAVCLGMAFFLTWFVIHNKYYSALRVAVFAGLGGGFGFAFGNFLQVLGNTTDIHFNFWNVMEYSLGFFGGLGMAYGTFTSKWEEAEPTQSKSSNFVPMLLVVLLIPFVVWHQSFGTERLQGTLSKLVSGDVDAMVCFVQILAISLILLQVAFVVWKYSAAKQKELQYSQKDVKTFFMSHFALYMVFSALITGAFLSVYRIEQYLYFANYIIILLVLPKLNPAFQSNEINTNKWLKNFLLVLLFIGILALIAINSHGVLNGAHERFEF